jgi:hypothetical protein
VACVTVLNLFLRHPASDRDRAVADLRITDRRGPQLPGGSARKLRRFLPQCKAFAIESAPSA